MNSFVVALQMRVCSNLKGSSSRDNAFVLNCILNCSEPISDSIFDLGDGVLIWASDEESAGGRVLASFNEGVLILSKCLFTELIVI